MSDVSLDEVGNAEAVLQRMIHERKTLENAATLLATYRSVKVQIDQVQQALVKARGTLSQVQSDTSKAEQVKDVAIAHIQKEVAQYRQEQFVKATAEAEQWKAMAAGEKEKLTQMQDAVIRLQQQHATLTAKYTQEIREAGEQLADVKKQHTALTAQLQKAAAQFTIVT
jgi:predicted  nucleic acid-binding Zn-ribbon protein